MLHVSVSCGTYRKNFNPYYAREDWNTLVGTLGVPVSVDVRSTPLAGVSYVSSVVASIAHQFGHATARVSVFRYHAADVPTPINLDEYDVWTNLSSHPKLPEILVAASTSDNENFRAFCQENVFLVKRQPGPDHWLTTVPSSVTVLIEARSQK